MSLWARVLAEISGSRAFAFVSRGGHRRRILDLLAGYGVGGSGEPGGFLATPGPRLTYLEYYHRFDLVLDTFPYNGHTTNLDALWMGVPVVTLAGQRVSRGGLSILGNLGLPELAAHNEDEFVSVATRLARDLPRKLAELRKTLRARMQASVLMDATGFARQIAGAYSTMRQDWCAREGHFIGRAELLPPEARAELASRVFPP